MNAEQWNKLYPVGAPVVAYPGARPEDGPFAERLVTHTRSAATRLGSHADVVWVGGHSAGIALTHVDPICDNLPSVSRVSLFTFPAPPARHLPGSQAKRRIILYRKRKKNIRKN